MATKKTAAIPEEEILTAAADETTSEHPLHQTETESEKSQTQNAVQLRKTTE